MPKLFGTTPNFGRNYHVLAADNQQLETRPTDRFLTTEDRTPRQSLPLIGVSDMEDEQENITVQKPLFKHTPEKKKEEDAETFE